MSKVFLIHGSMVGVPSFYKSSEALTNQIKDGMFTIFREELSNHNPDYYLFKWMSEHDPKQKLNPKADLDSYYQEQQLVLTKQLQSKLYSQLQTSKPQVIVTHSMGSELIINTIEQYGLPTSVKTIITINSDSPEDRIIPDNNIKWVNICSNSDLTLIASTILNENIKRAGLAGFLSPKVNNIDINIYGNHNLALTMSNVKKIILDELE